MTILDDVEVRDFDIPDDTPPAGQINDVDDDIRRCQFCGTPLDPDAHGRTKYCDDHKTLTSRNEKSTGAGTRTRGAKGHGKIAEGMTAIYGMIGFAVGAVYMPTLDEAWLRDKEIIHANAENCGEAWAKVCDTNPKIRKRVEQFLD